MAKIAISSGLIERGLPETQVIIVSSKKYLKTLQFSILASKLKGVDENVFEAALESTATSTPLYLNLAKIISLPGETSRHNSPTNSDILFKELKSTTTPEGIKSLSVVLFSPYEHLVAHVGAIAKAFPSYSRKTKKNSLEEISVEIVVTDDKSLSDADMKFLNSLGEHMRICTAQVDAPCNEMNSETFANEAIRLVDELGVPIKKTIIKGEELKEKGFGGIYHVGKAAIYPPVFVSFTYNPSGASKNIAVSLNINFFTN